MGNEGSVEHKESQLEKSLKEKKEDQKDDAIVRRSQRNGAIQNAKGLQKYNRYGDRIMTNQTYESVINREDTTRTASIPIGWMKYRSTDLDTTLWTTLYFSGWRISVPRNMPWPQIRYLLRRMYVHGPASCGYVAVGDTLVPQKVLVSNRAVLNAL